MSSFQALHEQYFFVGLSKHAHYHWPVHVQRSARSEHINNFNSRLQDFLGRPTASSAVYRSWQRKIAQQRFNYGSALSLYPVKMLDLEPSFIAGFAFCAFGILEFVPGWLEFAWVKQDCITKKGFNFLKLVMLSGSISSCKILIENGAVVNAQTNLSYGNALTTAAFDGQKEIVQLLVKEGGADVNMQLQHGDFGSALASAACGGVREVVRFLLREGGAKVNMHIQFGNYGSALAAAAYEGDGIVELLIEEGAEVNIQLQYGKFGSALAVAAAGGDEEIVEFLIREGAEVNMQLKYGEYGSALSAAAARDEDGIVKLLVKNGADTNMQLKWGEYGSALAAAAAAFRWTSASATIEYLVEGGANINMQLQHGEYATALEAGEHNGRSWNVELLIKHGAIRKASKKNVIEKESDKD